MAQRSRRPRPPVDYSKRADAAKPAWMRAEDRQIFEDDEEDASSDLDLDVENVAAAKQSRSKSGLPAATTKSRPSSTPLKSVINREAKPLSERMVAHNKRDANHLHQDDTTSHQAPAAKKTKSDNTKGKQVPGKDKPATDSNQHKSGSSGSSSQQHNSSQDMAMPTSSSAQPARSSKGRKSSASNRRVSSMAAPEVPAGAEEHYPAVAPAAGGGSGRSSSNGTHKKSQSQERQVHGPASTNRTSKKQLRGSSNTGADKAGAAEEPLKSADIGTAATAAVPAPSAAAAVMPHNAQAVQEEPLAKRGKERHRKSTADVLLGSAAHAAIAAPEMDSAAAAAASKQLRSASTAAQCFDATTAPSDPAAANPPQHCTTGPTTAGASSAPSGLFVAEAAALPQAATGAVDGTPGAETSEFLQLQAEYSRLHAMYEDLKQQKIKELEGLVEEQESYVLRMGQEAKQLAEHWRMEAEQQRHSAACARAPETARSIKLLQDSKLAADQALLQKEREVLQLQAQIAELHQQLATACLKPDVADAAVQVAEDEIARDAAAAQEAAATPAPPGCQFAGVQCPTPAAPSPGVGVQFPTPAAAVQASVAAGTALPAGASDSPLAAARDQSYATAAGVPRFPGLSPLGSSSAAVAAVVIGGGGGAASKGSGSPVKGLVTAQQHATSVAACTAPAAAAVSGSVPGAAAGVSAADAPAHVHVCSAVGVTAADTNGSGGCGSGGSCGSGGRSGAGGAAAPYHTPGGINAFMFAAVPGAAAGVGMPRTQVAADAPAGAVVGEDFTFAPSPQRAAASSGTVPPVQQQQQQQQAAHLAFPYVGEMQGSMDNGSCILDKTLHTVQGVQGGAAAVGAAAVGLRAARGGMRGSLADRDPGAAPPHIATALGTPVPSAAPHNTPVGLGLTAVPGTFSTPGMSGVRGAHRPADSPTSSSASRIRIREQALQQVRLQLMTGIGQGLPATAAALPAAAAQAQSNGRNCEAGGAGLVTEGAVCGDGKGGKAPAAVEAGQPLQDASAVAIAPGGCSPARLAAGQMGNQGRVHTSPGRVPSSPQAGPGRTPHCTPNVTPQTSPALQARKLQPARLAAVLADMATQQGQDAGSSPQGLHCTPGRGLAAEAAAGVSRAGHVLASPLSVTRQQQEQQPLTGVQSAGRSLVLATKMLCDFNTRAVINDVVEYEHSATGFVFQLHPADSRLTPATPLGTPGASGPSPHSTRKAAAAGGDGNASSMSGLDSSEGPEEEEEVTFVPISLGTAEGSMPYYLKEPITFAASQKAQFMTKLFNSLLTATAPQAAAAAERPLQQQRRRSKHSDTQHACAGAGSDPAAAAANPFTEDKENATGTGAADAASGKVVAADTGAAAPTGLALSKKH